VVIEWEAGPEAPGQAAGLSPAARRAWPTIVAGAGRTGRSRATRGPRNRLPARERRPVTRNRRVPSRKSTASPWAAPETSAMHYLATDGRATCVAVVRGLKRVSSWIPVVWPAAAECNGICLGPWKHAISQSRTCPSESVGHLISGKPLMQVRTGPTAAVTRDHAARAPPHTSSIHPVAVGRTRQCWFSAFCPLLFQVPVRPV